jgi:hypothetical protein
MSDSPSPRLRLAARLPFVGGLLVGALAVVGAGIVILAVVLVGGVMLTRGHGNADAPAQVEAKAAKEVFAVAAVNPLHGTNAQEIVIATDSSIRRGDAGSYSGGGAPDERNVILLDKTSGVSRKLLPDNGRRIVSRDYLPAMAGAGEEGVDTQKAPLGYYVFRVRAADGARQDVLVGDLATGRQAYLLAGIDGIDKAWMQSPTRLALLMRQGRKLQYRAIEIPDLKVVVARPVEID